MVHWGWAYRLAFLERARSISSRSHAAPPRVKLVLQEADEGPRLMAPILGYSPKATIAGDAADVPDEKCNQLEVTDDEESNTNLAPERAATKRSRAIEIGEACKQLAFIDLEELSGLPPATAAFARLQ